MTTTANQTLTRAQLTDDQYEAMLLIPEARLEDRARSMIASLGGELAPADRLPGSPGWRLIENLCHDEHATISDARRLLAICDTIECGEE